MKGLKQFICLGARGRELPEADWPVFGWFGGFWLGGVFLREIWCLGFLDQY